METWSISEDQATATVTGRALQPWYKKINPVWWLGNDNEPWPPDWQLPGKPYWLRVVSWYLRNPLENFSNYVIGVSDRNYTATGTPPIMVTAWNDVGKTGWKHSVIHLGTVWLPFVSYAGKRWMFYLGWQVGGFAGVKINLLDSPIQVV